LAWGGDNSAFIFEAEYQILFGKGDTADSFAHPMVLLPFVGQLLMLIALFQKKPDKRLVLSGIALMSLLFLLLFAIGLMGGGYKITLSTLPFIGFSAWYIRSLYTQK
ncbi:MAG: hypothetical protein HUU01_23400, partial [Saprospiraceae bacterium]|nr:hypothetical protein [Saprospiraceae bacterium]